MKAANGNTSQTEKGKKMPFLFSVLYFLKDGKI